MRQNFTETNRMSKTTKTEMVAEMKTRQIMLKREEA